jgi:hypothetical protein
MIPLTSSTAGVRPPYTVLPAISTQPIAHMRQKETRIPLGQVGQVQVTTGIWNGDSDKITRILLAGEVRVKKRNGPNGESWYHFRRAWIKEWGSGTGTRAHMPLSSDSGLESLFWVIMKEFEIIVHKRNKHPNWDSLLGSFSSPLLSTGSMCLLITHIIFFDIIGLQLLRKKLIILQRLKISVFHGRPYITGKWS